MRPATPADLDLIVEQTRSAMARYVDFAPEGWSVDRVDPAEHRRRILATLENPEAVAEIAEGGAGHFAWQPQEGRAHLLALFVEPHAWGTGLATRLHARAIATMRERGFAEATLITPAGQARARRFYEREGWRATGDERFAEGFGLVMVGYRRDLA